MNAFFASNRLSAYIDGALSDAEMAEVEQAIRDNPEIRAEYSRLRSAVDRLREQGPVQAPPGFSDRLAARLALEKMPKQRWTWLPSGLRTLPFEAVGLAMAALLVVFLIQRDPHPELPPEVVAQETAPPAAPTELEAQKTPLAAPTQLETQKTPLATPTPPAASKTPLAAPTQSKSEKTPLAAPTVDWEDRYEQAGRSKKEASPAATVTLGPVRYRLYPKSPEALWQIQKLAKRYGVRLMTSSGKLAKPFSMTTEENYANLKLQMSPARLEAFVVALKDLGAMTLVEQDASKLYSGGMMELELEVQFEP
jgi:negative regulator of sigma E activity